jgi:phospholipase A1
MNTSIKQLGFLSPWSGLILLLLASPLCLAQETSLVQESEDSAGTTRMDAEAATSGNRFVLTPHKRNYFLVTYSDFANASDDQFQELTGDDDAELDDAETQFQVSLKVALLRDTFADGDAVQFGFTIKSFWQTFNDDQSSPFRETNYQPEIWYRTPIPLSIVESDTMLWGIGAEHQSNGRTQELSRSWNRVYTTLTWLSDDLAFRFKPWYRIPECDKDKPTDSDCDDNPDIHKYMGYFEMSGIWHNDEYEVGVEVRNNVGSGASHSRGAVQVDFTFPLWGRVRGYAQLFNGYGQSLIDYNNNITSAGVGFLLSDIL